jgi:AcrR family transcriptional regulator
MCSAASSSSSSSPSPSGRSDDTRNRLIAAAIELIGRDGIRATTVRRLADAVGVSAPLVVHHFGSKAGLVAACDAAVSALLDDAMAAIAEAGGDDGTLQAMLQLEGAGPAIAYIGRSLQDGGDAGRRWFDHMITATADSMAELEAAGRVRPTDDPDFRAVLLAAMDIGVVLLRGHVERLLGASIDDPGVTERWIRAEFDLLSHGLFTHPQDDELNEPDDPDHQNEDEEHR